MTEYTIDLSWEHPEVVHMQSLKVGERRNFMCITPSESPLLAEARCGGWQEDGSVPPSPPHPWAEEAAHSGREL